MPAKARTLSARRCRALFIPHLLLLCQHDDLIALGEVHPLGFLRIGMHTVGWRLAGFSQQPVADGRLAAAAGRLDQGVEINSEIVPINLTGSRVSFYT